MAKQSKKEKNSAKWKAWKQAQKEKGVDPAKVRRKAAKDSRGKG